MLAKSRGDDIHRHATHIHTNTHAVYTPRHATSDMGDQIEYMTHTEHQPCVPPRAPSLQKKKKKKNKRCCEIKVATELVLD